MNSVKLVQKIIGKEKEFSNSKACEILLDKLDEMAPFTKADVERLRDYVSGWFDCWSCV